MYFSQREHRVDIFTKYTLMLGNMVVKVYII
ncbi:Uncharacterised protein [Citrobacter werkmanii]|nr:Uncharacterised protein [Citrobacter werkmanii]